MMLFGVLSVIVLLDAVTSIAGITVKGQIEFQNGVPEALDPNTWLTVKIEDGSLQDAPSTVLGKNITQIKNYENGAPLTFEVTDLKIPKSSYPHSASISAVINVGWKPSGNQWIHENDYLSDTNIPVDLSSNQQSLVVNVPVIKYT